MSKLEENYKSFFERSSNTIRQKKDYSIFESVAEYYDNIIKLAPSYYTRYKLAKNRATFYKYKGIKDLYDNLVGFESRFTKNGGKVIYADDKDQALSEILQIIKSHNDSQVLLSFEHLLKEIDLYDKLKEEKIDYFMPSLHSLFFPINQNSHGETTKKLSEDLNIGSFADSSIDVMGMYKKVCLNKAYKNSISIMEAESVVADIGGVVILDQEGDKTIQQSYSQIQIIVAGIDQLLSSVSEMELFNSLKSTHCYGEYFPWGQTIFTGPKKKMENDGPSEVYLIWIDNGRSEIMSYKAQREVLNCINCRACEALCPVFKFTKSKDDTNYRNRDGPISCITSPIKDGLDKYSYLSFACTLCGKCEEVCPVDISLPELILYTRKEAVENGYGFGLDKSQIKVFKKMFLKRKSMESARNRFILKRSGIKKEFGTQRVFPDFKQKSFNVLWAERYKKGSKEK